MDATALASSRTRGSLDREGSVPRGNFALPAAILAAVGLAPRRASGTSRPRRRAFPFEVLAIFVALDAFTAMVASTGIGDAAGYEARGAGAAANVRRTMVGSRRPPSSPPAPPATLGSRRARLPGAPNAPALDQRRSALSARLPRADDGHGQPRRRRDAGGRLPGPRDRRHRPSHELHRLPRGALAARDHHRRGTSGRVHRPYSPPLARVRVRSPSPSEFGPSCLLRSTDMLWWTWTVTCGSRSSAWPRFMRPTKCRRRQSSSPNVHASRGCGPGW